MLRVIIVGGGRRGSEHARLWQRAGHKLVAVVDPDVGRAALLAARLGAEAFAELTAALARHPEAAVVDICSPPIYHAGQIEAALMGGRHVLCEKPLVMDPAEAQRLQALAEAKARLLTAAHNWLGAPPLRRARAAVARGELGELVVVHTSLVSQHVNDAMGIADPTHWVHSLPGGRVEEVLPHAVYTSLAFLEDPQARLTDVATAKRTPYEWVTFDTLWASLEGGGRRATIFVTFASEVTRYQVELIGTKQVWEVTLGVDFWEETGVRYDYDSPTHLLNVGVQLLRGAGRRVFELGRRGAAKLSRRSEGADLWLVRGFAAGVEKGAPPPVSLSDAVATVRLTREIIDGALRRLSGAP